MIAEVEDANGRIFRWSGDERSSEDVPQGIQFRTQRGDGFADMSCVLTRRIDRDYPDLNLMDTIRLVNDDGSIAYEGRLTSNSRSLGDAGHSIQVEAVGWMTHARDRTFREIYVDRDLGAWTGMGTQRKINLIGTYSVNNTPTVQTDVTTGSPALALTVDGEWTTSPGLPINEAWYDARGLEIGSLYYAWRDNGNGSSATWLLNLGLADTDHTETANATGDIHPGASATVSGTLSSTAMTRRFAYAHFLYASNAANAQPGVSFGGWFTVLAAYGAHGLTKRGTGSATSASGFYASDVIANIAQRFCPRLDTANVEDTTYAIGQIAWKDATEPYDAFLDLNSFHDWEFAVWENRSLHFHTPTPLDDYDWEVRLDDPGVRVQLEGDSTERLANGVVVTYTDLIHGTTQTVTPEDELSLADTSEANPANVHGIDKWITVEVPFPTIRDDAIQWGVAALAQFNTPSSPGRITVTGHIRDRQGNWRQGQKVRAGERVVISDHPNDRARRITATSWNHDSRTLEIEVEQDQRRLEVIAARIARARQTAGLT